MHNKTNSFKPSAVVIALLIILLAASVMCYKERMLFIDAPHILFRIINIGSLQIQESRYGSFITQLLPWAGMHLQFSLKALMILYSASFNLFYLSVALLLIYKFRRSDLAIIFALYLTLFTSDTFFWPNDEVHQGIGWLMLAFGAIAWMVKNKRPFLLTALLFIVLFGLAIWSHPLVIFPAVYLWLFFWLSGTEWPFTKRQSILFTLLLAAITVYKLWQSRLHGYDSGKLDVVFQFNYGSLLSVFHSPQSNFFLRSLVTNYWAYAVILIVSSVYLAASKRYILLALTLMFTFSYYILLCILYGALSGLRYYIESEYMPISIFAVAPFVYFFLRRLTPAAITLVLAVIFIARLSYIVHSEQIFAGRLHTLENISDKLSEKGLTKVIVIDKNDALEKKLLMSWGMPVETMMLSKLKHESPQRTLIFLSPEEMDKESILKIGKYTLLGCFVKWYPGTLNPHYFNIDTTAAYKVISMQQLLN